MPCVVRNNIKRETKYHKLKQVWKGGTDIRTLKKKFEILIRYEQEKSGFNNVILKKIKRVMDMKTGMNNKERIPNIMDI